MAQIPGIYVEIKGDSTQLAKDMRQAKQIVSESAKGMSNALNNALSGSQISKGTNTLINSLGQLNRASKVSGQTFKQLGVDLGSLQRVTGVTGSQFQALQSRMLQTAGAKAQEKALRDIARAADLTEKEIRQLGQQFGLSSAQINKVNGDINKAGQSFSVFGAAVRTALAYLSIESLISFARGVVDAGIKLDSLNRSFLAITGSAQGAQAEMEYLRETATRTGQNFYALTDSFRQLMASTQGTKIAGEETRKVFVSMSEAAAVLGLSNQQLELSLKAFSQMAGKGVVQMEELKNQLGDSLPGAVNIAARAMGVSVKKLMEMSQAGELLAEDLLPKMAEQLHKMYGAAAQTAALDSGIAAINRFNQAWTDLKANLYDNDAFVFAADTLSTAFNFYAEKLRDDNSLAGIKEKLEDQGKVLEHNKQLLDEYQTGWSKGSPETISALTVKIRDQEKALGDLQLKLLQAQNASDPAVKAAVAAGQKITDVWVKSGEEQVEAISRAATYETKALEEQAKIEELASKRIADAVRQRAEEQQSITEEMTDMIKTSAMTQTEVELYELEKRKAANMEAAAGNIALQKKITEAYASEQDRLTMLIEAGIDKRTAAEWEALEKLEDGWLDFNEGKTAAAERAGQEIQAVEKETTNVIIDEWSNAFESIQSALADMIYEFDFSMDSILDIFKRMLAEMLAAIVTSGIKDAFLGLFGGGGGGTGGGIVEGIKELFSGSGGGSGSGWGAVGGGLALAGGAYGMYSGAKNLKEGNAGAGALQLGVGAISAYKGAVTLGLLEQGAATAAAKSIGAKLGIEVGVSAGKTLGTTLAQSAGTRSAMYASQQALFSGGSTAGSSGTAAGGSGIGMSGAAIGAAATYATVAAAAVMVMKGIYDKSQRPNAANEIDYAGVTTTGLTAIYDQWKALDATVLASIPGFQNYEKALYSTHSQILVATGSAGTLALKYNEAAAAGHQWEQVMSAAPAALLDATAASQEYQRAISGAADEMGESASIAEIDRQNLEGLNAVLSETGSSVSVVTDAMSGLADATSGAASVIGHSVGDIYRYINDARSATYQGPNSGADQTSYHAAGGIFTGTTRIGSHVFGEAGPEAIVPLPFGPDSFEKLFDRIDKIGGAPVIHVYIGNEKLDARIQVVSDRLDADRDPLARGRRYHG